MCAACVMLFTPKTLQCYCRVFVHTKSDRAFIEDFGISQAKVSFVCKGGWTICDVHNETKRVAETHPDYLILFIGSNDLAQGELQKEP